MTVVKDKRMVLVTSEVVGMVYEDLNRLLKIIEGYPHFIEMEEYIQVRSDFRGSYYYAEVKIHRKGIAETNSFSCTSSYFSSEAEGELKVSKRTLIREVRAIAIANTYIDFIGPLIIKERIEKELALLKQYFDDKGRSISAVDECFSRVMATIDPFLFRESARVPDEGATVGRPLKMKRDSKE